MQINLKAFCLVKMNSLQFSYFIFFEYKYVIEYETLSNFPMKQFFELKFRMYIVLFVLFLFRLFFFRSLLSVNVCII